MITDSSPPTDPLGPPIQPLAVYRMVRPDSFIVPEEMPVPRLLSREFHAFLAVFLANPWANPLFLKEWRRSRNRLGWMGTHWPFALVIAAVVGAIGYLALLVGVRSLGSDWAQRLAVWAIVFAPTVLLAAWSLARALFWTQELGSRSVQEQYAATPMHSQEVVFGHITGQVAPLAVRLAPLLPGLGLFLFDVSVRDSVAPGAFTAVFAAAALAYALPDAAATLLFFGGMAACLTFGRAGLAGSTARVLFVGIVISVVLFPIPYLAMVALGGITYALLMPALIALKLLVAGVFLNHLAVRLACEVGRE